MEQHVLTEKQGFLDNPPSNLRGTWHIQRALLSLLQSDRQRGQTIISESRETRFYRFYRYNVEDHDLNWRQQNLAQHRLLEMSPPRLKKFKTRPAGDGNIAPSSGRESIIAAGVDDN